MDMQIFIHQASMDDLNSVSEMALMLWPEGNTISSLKEEISIIMADEKSVIFLARKNNVNVGFAHCQVRHDYVEGTNTSPVGYLEGFFVQEKHRSYGIGTKLIHACEEWLREKEILEIASDTEIINSASIRFHLHNGFSEVNRIVCFSKRI